MDPDTGRWLARDILYAWGREDKDRGRHYNHSTFIDLVITGLCGICPAEDEPLTVKPLGTALDHFSLDNVLYHGHTLSLSWRKNDGLRLTVDGKRKLFAPASDNASITVEL
jgi:hypothetical protein